MSNFSISDENLRAINLILASLTEHTVRRSLTDFGLGKADVERTTARLERLCQIFDRAADEYTREEIKINPV
jgi:hypothetical protein